MLVEHSKNPNRQDEATFDTLVEKIKTDGQDEPIIVAPYVVKGRFKNKYRILSGHHRAKACKKAGLPTVDCIIRENWDEDKQDIELISRNQLRGQIDPERFTKLFNELQKKHDPELLRRKMGITSKKQFDKLYRQVRDQLPPSQRKKLDEAKEEVKSIDDLQSVLNTIFKENGSRVDNGFLVFSFGGKEHIYVKATKELKPLIDAVILEAEESDTTVERVLARYLSGLGTTPKRRKKRVKAKAKKEA